MPRWTRTLPVGETCWYWPRGDYNRDPVAAIVTATDQFGLLTLATLAPNHRAVGVATGVHHKDDPFLEEYPDRATENGAWTERNYTPAEQPKPIPASVDVLEVFKRNKSDHGATAKELSATTGQPWDRKMVQREIEKLATVQG
jgi:hypothetical protein